MVTNHAIARSNLSFTVVENDENVYSTLYALLETQDHRPRSFITTWHHLLYCAESRLKPEAFRRLASLTPAETRVFLLLALQGLPNKCLAAKLNIHVRTVETHRANVFHKLGLRYPMQLRDLLDEILKATR